jgi:hypothetical protein
MWIGVVIALLARCFSPNRCEHPAATTFDPALAVRRAADPCAVDRPLTRVTAAGMDWWYAVRRPVFDHHATPRPGRRVDDAACIRTDALPGGSLRVA